MTGAPGPVHTCITAKRRCAILTRIIWRLGTSIYAVELRRRHQNIFAGFLGPPGGTEGESITHRGWREQVQLAHFGDEGTPQVSNVAWHRTHANIGWCLSPSTGYGRGTSLRRNDLTLPAVLADVCNGPLRLPGRLTSNRCSLGAGARDTAYTGSSAILRVGRRHCLGSIVFLLWTPQNHHPTNWDTSMIKWGDFIDTHSHSRASSH